MAVGRLSGLSGSILSFLQAQEEGPDHAFPTAGATTTATSFLMEAERCLEMELFSQWQWLSLLIA